MERVKTHSWAGKVVGPAPGARDRPGRAAARAGGPHRPAASAHGRAMSSTALKRPCGSALGKSRNHGARRGFRAYTLRIRVVRGRGGNDRGHSRARAGRYFPIAGLSSQRCSSAWSRRGRDRFIASPQRGHIRVDRPGPEDQRSPPARFPVWRWSWRNHVSAAFTGIEPGRG